MRAKAAAARAASKAAAAAAAQNAVPRLPEGISGAPPSESSARNGNGSSSGQEELTGMGNVLPQIANPIVMILWLSSFTLTLKIDEKSSRRILPLQANPGKALAEM